MNQENTYSKGCEVKYVLVEKYTFVFTFQCSLRVKIVNQRSKVDVVNLFICQIAR